MSGAMNRHCIPVNYLSTAWRGTSLRECPGIIKTAQGLACNVHYASSSADTEETGRYDLAMERFV